jgi:hypothetical protein
MTPAALPASSGSDRGSGDPDLGCNHKLSRELPDGQFAANLQRELSHGCKYRVEPALGDFGEDSSVVGRIPV